MNTTYRIIGTAAIVLVLSVSVFATETTHLPNIQPLQSAQLAQQENVNIPLDLWLYDSYGDGWDGAVLYVYNSNNIVVASVTEFTSGYEYYTYFNLPAGCDYFIYVSEGNYPSEVSWVAKENAMYFLASGTTGTSEPFNLGTPIYGCSDPDACNYSGPNTCDDGSCCYGLCHYLIMMDSYGDGWNGAYITITGNDGTEYVHRTMSGTYASITFCAPNGCYHIKVTAGGYPSEITWQVAAQDAGDVYATEGAPFDNYIGFLADCNYNGCVNPDACNYDPSTYAQTGSCCFTNCGTFNQFDSYGDGWNGATFQFTDWNDELVYEGSLVSGSSGHDDLCLQDGCYQVSVSGGLYPGEISWYYIDNNISVSGVANETKTVSIGTLISGCTDATAVNYNALANCADPCIYTCKSDLDGNGQVNVADLLIFTSDFGEQCY